MSNRNLLADPRTITLAPLVAPPVPSLADARANHKAAEARLAQARTTHSNLRAALTDPGALPSVRLAAKRDIEDAGADVLGAEADIVVAAAALAKAEAADQRVRADALMPRLAAAVKTLDRALETAREARESLTSVLDDLRPLRPTLAQDVASLAAPELVDGLDLMSATATESALDYRRARLRAMGLLGAE